MPAIPKQQLRARRKPKTPPARPPEVPSKVIRLPAPAAIQEADSVLLRVETSTGRVLVDRLHQLWSGALRAPEPGPQTE